jgi:hypothetical protein
LLTPGPSRYQAKLKNPASSQGQDHNRSEHHREQQGDRQGQVPMEDREVHLHALEVLKNEDEDHDQGNDANDKRRPRSTQTGLALARVRFPRLYVLTRGRFHRSNLALKHVVVEFMRELDDLQAPGARPDEFRHQPHHRPDVDDPVGNLELSADVQHVRCTAFGVKRSATALVLCNGYRQLSTLEQQAVTLPFLVDYFAHAVERRKLAAQPRHIGPELLDRCLGAPGWQRDILSGEEPIWIGQEE